MTSLRNTKESEAEPLPGDEPSREKAWAMFDRIAPRYDLLNRLMTLGMDVRWRKRMAAFLPPGDGLSLLDLATGTGDQILMMMDEKTCRIGRAVGMDLAEEMLALGREKVIRRGLSDRVDLQTGDAMAIPAEDGHFDAVTISFGIRNVLDVPTALGEMRRVLRPGGRVLILETSRPEAKVLQVLHRAYVRHVIPTVGGLVSGDRAAYRYLNRTVETFPSGRAFCERMEAAGFLDVAALPLALGAASIYRGDVSS